MIFDNLEEKTVSSETVYDGKIMTVKKDVVELSNKKIVTREYLEKGYASVIVAKTNENKLILEYQYRYPYHDVICEFPAGKAEKNEDPKITALRELEEETGYKAKKIEYIGKMYPSPAYTDEVIYIYLATDLEKTKVHRDPGEFMYIKEYSIEEIEKMINEEKIVDAKSQIAFYKYLTYIKKEN